MPRARIIEAGRLIDIFGRDPFPRVLLTIAIREQCVYYTCIAANLIQVRPE